MIKIEKLKLEINAGHVISTMVVDIKRFRNEIRIAKEEQLPVQCREAKYFAKIENNFHIPEKVEEITGLHQQIPIYEVPKIKQYQTLKHYWTPEKLMQFIFVEAVAEKYYLLPLVKPLSDLVTCDKVSGSGYILSETLHLISEGNITAFVQQSYNICDTRNITWIDFILHL